MRAHIMQAASFTLDASYAASLHNSTHENSSQSALLPVLRASVPQPHFRAQMSVLVFHATCGTLLHVHMWEFQQTSQSLEGGIVVALWLTQRRGVSGVRRSSQTMRTIKTQAKINPSANMGRREAGAHRVRRAMRV